MGRGSVRYGGGAREGWRPGGRVGDSGCECGGGRGRGGVGAGDRGGGGGGCASGGNRGRSTAVGVVLDKGFHRAAFHIRVSAYGPGVVEAGGDRSLERVSPRGPVDAGHHAPLGAVPAQG